MTVSKDPAEMHALMIAKSVFQGVVMTLDERVPELPLAQLLQREWFLTRAWPQHQYPDQEGRKGEVLIAAATQLKAAVIKHYISLRRIAQQQAADGQPHNDPDVILEPLDYLVYPPVLDPAALRSAILAGVAKRDAMDQALESMTPNEAWEGFVGDQSTADFWQLSQEQGAGSYLAACHTYAEEMPHMTEEWSALTAAQKQRIASLLAQYLERNLGPTTAK